MAEIGRKLWRLPGLTSLFKHSHLKQVTQGHVWTAAEYYKRKTPQTSWETYANVQSEVFFWCSEGASCVSFSSHCPWSCHWAPSVNYTKQSQISQAFLMWDISWFLITCAVCPLCPCLICTGEPWTGQRNQSVHSPLSQAGKD